MALRASDPFLKWQNDLDRIDRIMVKKMI